ncbi:winged helix-turn-helix domain-containing protein [Psychromonas ossibalaenae]|uniref:winged helix-turn-helix domain-containing protein n=1 Tax=Psychromonas ossibalaenae TaxID=444922 RepID=UPI00036D34F1|nr:response regulator transcription factor [Psychromonas ossibalaenae]
MSKKILVLEDQNDIANLIRINLEMLGFEVKLYSLGKPALTALKQDHFDLLLLDLNLPDIDGLSICKTLRVSDNPIPILMLTARADELDRVMGLEMGADDYLTKPFSVLELQARVKALLRRSQQQEPPASKAAKLVLKGIEIDLELRDILVLGKKIELTSTEFDLLIFLAEHPGRVFSRQQLLESVWDYHNECYEHTVNSHINRLRNKIEPQPSDPQFIKTVWGVGYKLESGK